MCDKNSMICMIKTRQSLLLAHLY
uniref:Uncharacterized protein n=1 Tax=Anguilla anguilla TaxID=7936 RepID=A0A0E9QC21_ANGAN